MKVHFIAIGGSAMHNLAIAMKNNRHDVGGSDDEIFEPSRSRLSDNSLLPARYGWYPEEISKDIDAIILGMHARIDNPELLRAKELGLKIYSYPEFLYYHSKNKKRVVIGGSHGKTTITAIIMHVLRKLNYDFDYLVGSKIKDFDVMVRLSEDAPIMIFEGDEYLSSPIDLRPKFHWYFPDIALLSGIAWDHINVFPTWENYIEQFEKFISLINKNGSLIYNVEDKILEKLASARNDISTVSYRIPKYEIQNGINYMITDNGEVELKIFGKHNMMNINGARLVCNQLGIDDKDFFAAVSSFEGTANRLELVMKNGSNRLYKDFAHAPSKVHATVEAVREQFPLMNFVACLELHTFSSLNKKFIAEYNHTLDASNHACVYFNEHTLAMKRLPNLDIIDVVEAFKRDDLKVFVNSKDMMAWLNMIKKPNTVYLMMSSGNFDGINFDNRAMQLLS
jgi:UDP-N-acetylmuramate: L-alanyl-gamma-D-glutamyl-meso-diaminopimelate ligase|tara:strand:- start:43 stop:1398 length:1356 start_codon:yes stop_codon:yes gene_type:complete